jgi:hypothetical protein
VPMKPRIKMRAMPGDISKGAKIAMLEGRDPRKKVSKSFKNLIRMRERATLKQRTEEEIKNARNS